jgi:transcriptional regulator with XRE-family HTH domain
VNADDVSLGKYIRRLRESQGLSLLALSTKCGVAYAHLSRIENESTVPSPETIVRICRQLDGDLTLMLKKADNLPRVILDRLIERDQAVKAQTLRRALPGGDQESAGPGSAPLPPAATAELTEGEVAQLSEAMQRLVTLRPHARRAVIELISVLQDEGDGDSG